MFLKINDNSIYPVCGNDKKLPTRVYFELLNLRYWGYHLLPRGLIHL